MSESVYLGQVVRATVIAPVIVPDACATTSPDRWFGTNMSQLQ